MKIKDLIAQLELLYNTYDNEYKETVGEPEIMIDVFRLKYPNQQVNYDRVYAGISGNIAITKSSDLVYDILSAFDEDQNSNQKTEKLSRSTSAWPEIWQA